FPTEHLRRIIDAARAGQPILEVKVYDGAETGVKLYNATAVIGRRIEPGSGTVEEAARDSRLMGLARWPVTISYF
ncbi:EipB family protein, partial [Stenotrophomonas maltophilia]|uniref:EipB family protein n=1 Tax=Stenotrophomonas maltophilia TaxID=40324 RepID=UPI0013DB439E